MWALWLKIEKVVQAPDLVSVLIVFARFQQVIRSVLHSHEGGTCFMGIRLSCPSRAAHSAETTAGSRNLATGYNSICREGSQELSPIPTVEVPAHAGSSTTLLSAVEVPAHAGSSAALLSTVQDSQGSASTPAVGISRFRSAVRRVIRLLALRKKWAAYGRVLQETPRCKLWEGLERRKGELRRVKKLPSP